MGNSEIDAKLNFITQVYRMLDNLNYECDSRLYTIDDDHMSDIFYLRDMAYLLIKQYEKNKAQ